MARPLPHRGVKVAGRILVVTRYAHRSGDPLLYAELGLEEVHYGAPTIWVAKRLSRLGFESRNILASVSFIFTRKFVRNVDVPTWRAEYFDRMNGQSPVRSEIIAAANEAVALEEVRLTMTATYSRVEVTKVDSESKTASLTTVPSSSHRPRLDP